MRRALILVWLSCAACFDPGYGPEDFACASCRDATTPDASDRDGGPGDAGLRDGGSGAMDGGDAGASQDAGMLVQRRRIDVDTTGLAATLPDFPLLIRLDDTRVDYGEAMPQGEDLRFYAADGTTLLSHEIERWVVGGTSLVWVRSYVVPAAVGPTFLFMTYGDPTATAPSPQAVADTWSADFTAVLHFESQSLALANEVGTSATRIGGRVAPGAIGDAIALDGGEYVDLPLGRLSTSSGSACVWIRTAVVAFPDRIVLYGAAELGGDGFGRHAEMHMGLGSGSSNANLFFRGDAVFDDVNFETSDSGDDGAWHQLCAAWTSPSRVTYYFDGDPRVASQHGSSIFTASAILRLGGAGTPGLDFMGSIDEVHLSGAAFGDGWVWFQYRTVVEPNRLSFGPPVSVPRPR